MDQTSNAPLHLCHVNRLTIFINRTYAVIHSIALSFLLYYRASFFFQDTKTPIFPSLIVFAAELLFSFEWLLTQAYRWRPVSRTTFPERLPEDDKLPAIDVFICTADPDLEPTVAVMNTVISAMALDYPPEKLHVYLSDDAGADVTLNGMREAWTFAKRWIPFCKRYKIKCRSPKAYFSAAKDENEDGDFGGTDFIQERQIVQEKYEVFKGRVGEYARHGDTGSSKRGDHSAVIEVIQESSSNHIEENEAKDMPLLIYVSREKRPSHSHHFKAGAINVLLRVSGVISNSPFILGLDCDTNCNDPSSARRAMCFHLDPKLSPSLSFVQFPQKFHNISRKDIYDSQYRSIFKVLWQGLDGLQGPAMCGTGYYIKRLSLFGKSLKDDHKDLMELRQSVGPSNEFITSLLGNYNPNMKMAQLAHIAETQQLASCTYEDGTKWGEEAGFLYASVAEDFWTTFASLHCQGWNSVYCNPPRPQFLGRGFTNLNDFLVQGTRWSSAVVDIAISKYCPLIYGPSQISFLQRMCYAWFPISPICQLFSLWCLATIPQLCLVNGISLYPEVSNSYFWIFSFVLLSSVSRHLYEVLTTGASLQHWVYEQRIWMMNAVTSHLYGTLDAFMKKFGWREASFSISNKVDDIEQLKRYHAGVFDFQTSVLFLVPLASLVILNVASLCAGIARMIFLGELEKLFIQVFIPFYAVVINYPIIEGMLIRKDSGRIPPSVTLLSAIASIIFCVLGSIIFM